MVSSFRYPAQIFSLSLSLSNLTFTVERRARSFVADSVKASTARLMIMGGEERERAGERNEKGKEPWPRDPIQGTDRHRKAQRKTRFGIASRWILWRDGCDHNGSLNE